LDWARCGFETFGHISGHPKIVISSIVNTAIIVLRRKEWVIA